MAYYNPAQGHPQGHHPAPIVYCAAPAITYQQAVTKPYRYYYLRETSIGLGAIQIVIACVSIAAGVMAIVYGAYNYDSGVGIWAGAWYLVAGSLAIAASETPTTNLVIATLFFSFFNILAGIAEVSLASIGLEKDIEYYNCRQYHDDCVEWYGPAIAANSLMVAAGSLEIIFGIWMTVVSLRSMNKECKTQSATIPATCPQHQPEPMFTQAPSVHQPQPQPPPYYVHQPPPYCVHQPPPYCVHQQYPSTSNPQQQILNVGVHQAPLTTVNS